MRVLITGMSGFAGTALADFLLRETRWLLTGASSSASGERINARVQWWQVDLHDADATRRLIRYERPDIIFHLAAQASVPKSWDAPWDTFETNVHGTLNLFEAVIKAHTTPRIIVVGSNEVYGAPASPADIPFTESHPLHPNNPYGVSKVAQETLAMQYRYSHGLDVVVVRPFNHIGPGQKPIYVISDFAHQIAEIEAGKHEPVMKVGNLAAQRDFTDVRDTVEAYYRVARFADSGRIYNVCSGVPRSIDEVFKLLLEQSKVHIDVQTDPTKFRIVDTPVSYGDNSLLKQEVGWQPRVPLQTTITDTLNYWRQRVSMDTPA